MEKEPQTDMLLKTNVKLELEIDQVLCQISTNMYSRSLAKMTD
jgi:hypothetical protein